jgi:hypothetical protein
LHHGQAKQQMRPDLETAYFDPLADRHFGLRIS